MDSIMTLTGYVGHDMELRTTRSGLSAVNFRVGTTPRLRTPDGWIDGTTTWTSVVCYRMLADHVARSLAKGDPVIVHGRVRTQAWLGSDNEPHERVVVEALAVGHDLSRGVSSFARAVNRNAGGAGQAEPDPDPQELPDDEEDAVMDACDESQPGPDKTEASPTVLAV
ncbi:MAG: single-stranded DNA-binding protein [Propionibacteriaceae bacterium]|jgi:single-strand DNA-binding protein|nr:single-stranded DNA-binding protein [Propionibacteriaceae bacterium]